MNSNKAKSKGSMIESRLSTKDKSNPNSVLKQQATNFLINQG